MNGSRLPLETNIQETVLGFLRKALDQETVDAVILPKRVPSGDSFAYLIIGDTSILEGASPLPPIIPVQGAKAISRLTRQGRVRKKILAVMHPCEIRATIELYKLLQAERDNVFFLSFDCSGVLPLADYVENPETNDQTFREAFQNWESEEMRPVCKICTEFSAPASDLHIGLLGADEGEVLLIPFSPAGEQILGSLGMNPDTPVDDWEKEVAGLKNERGQKRQAYFESLKPEIKGPEKLSETLSGCINCHNCMRVCPVCYCRQCYFDSDAFKLSPENFLKRAEKRGSLRLPADTMLFHLGRMSHMIHSCVSCGTCEDACPMNIPVAQLFSLAADEAQKLFDYQPGRDADEPLPTVVYQEEEFQEVEKAYSETYRKPEGKNV